MTAYVWDSFVDGDGVRVGYQRLATGEEIRAYRARRRLLADAEWALWKGERVLILGTTR